MSVSRVKMPVSGFEMGDFQDDDAASQTDIGGNTKDWFRPAAASMAKLNQVQASVYSMGFKDASCLKPPRGMKKLADQQQQSVGLTRPPKLNSGQGDVGVESTPASFRDLERNPPLATLSYQKTAWGSNSSIPELIARHGNPNKPRPSSAKIHSQSRPQLKMRPQSAKDTRTDDLDSGREKSLGVLGTKKDVNSKAALKFVTAAAGTPVDDQTSARKTGRATAGPPAGHTMGTDDKKVAAKSSRRDVAFLPKAPYSSPVTSDGEEEEGTDRAPSALLLRRPLPESIHLSLPNADDNKYEEDEEMLSTDRLLQQADDFVQLKSEGDTNVMQHLQMAKASLPDLPVSQNVPDWTHHQPALLTATRQDPGIRCPLTALPPSGKPKNQKNANDVTIGRSDSTYTVNWSESSGDIETTNDLDSTKSTYEKERFSVQVTKHSEVTQPCPAVTSQSHNTTAIATSHKKFVLPNDEASFYEPLALVSSQVKTKPNIVQSKASVVIREDRNTTLDITPRNCARHFDPKPMPQNAQKPWFIAGARQGRKWCGIDEMSNLVPTVILNYEEERAGESKSRRDKRSLSEVTTLISKLSDSDPELQPLTCLTKSGTEKNYYEVSRLGSCPVSVQWSFDTGSGGGEFLNESPSDSDGGENTVYKTTKTLEFNPDCPVEIVSKSAISSAVKNRKYGESKAPRPSSALWPSAIKRQQVREKENSEEKTEEKTNNGMTESRSLHDLVELVYGAKPSAHKHKKSRSGHKKSGSKHKKDQVKHCSDIPQIGQSKVSSGVSTDIPHFINSDSKKVDLESKPSSQLTWKQMSSAEVKAVRPSESVQSRSNPTNPAKCLQDHKEDVKRYSMYSTPVRSTVQKVNTNSAVKSIVPKINTDAPVKSIVPRINTDAPVKSIVPKINTDAPVKSIVPKINTDAPVKSIVPKINTDAPVKSIVPRINTDAPRKSTVPKVHTDTRRVKSANSAGRNQHTLHTVTHQDELSSPETEECQVMKAKMAALGVEVSLQALQRALYPPSGKPLHYQVDGHLPSDPSHGLLPHYKHWLPEEYKKLQKIKRKLAKDDHLRHMKKVLEDRKMKRIGRNLLKSQAMKCPQKLVRSNSVS